MPDSSSSSKLHLAAIFCATLIWSVSFAATKTAFSAFPPFGLGMARFLLPALLIALFLLATGKFRLPEKKDVKYFLWSGFFGITAFYALENNALRLNTASDAALINSSFPAITMLLDRIIFKNPISLRSSLGVLIAMSGIFFIVSAQPPSVVAPDNRLLGNIFMILVGISWAGYNFTTRALVGKYPMPVVSMYQFWAGALLFIPLLPFDSGAWHVPDKASIMAYLFLSLFCSLIAYYLYAFGLKKVTPTRAMLIINLLPVFGVFFSVLLLDEKIYFEQIAGGAIIISGVMLGMSKKQT